MSYYGKTTRLLKTTVLITKASGGISCYLCVQVNDLVNYQQTNANVVNYCKTPSLSESAQSHAPTKSRTTDCGSVQMVIGAFGRTGKAKENTREMTRIRHLGQLLGALPAGFRHVSMHDTDKRGRVGRLA